MPDHASRDQDLLERLQALDALLPALASVLDIREVFTQVSAIARRVIRHDMTSLPLFDSDGEHLIVFAVAGNDVTFPTRVPFPEHMRPLRTEPWDHRIWADLQDDPANRDLPPTRAGYRALLAVPVRVHGELVGALDFYSFTPGIYTQADVVVARRIADHVALALSHQRLAEEAARGVEARERAAALERRVAVLTAEVASLGGPRQIIGEAPAWTRVLKQATQVAATDTTTLLLGESGTGKEVVARYIHRASTRSGGPFVALNCAALPEPLLESELFGYERGAFTGAQQAKPGQLEQASGGVLFLDEVGEMAPSAQAKFLRVLQEREFQRLGGTRTLRANIRVVAATNRDLRAAVARGSFREDLYYRLAVFGIQLPPLRERRVDILPLSEAFLRDISRTFGRPPAGIAREAREALMAHTWPGNVRELRNVLERAAILCDGGLITTEHLHLPARDAFADAVDAGEAGTRVLGSPPQTTDLRVLERTTIERALVDARHNKSLAAKRLGLTRKQLYGRLRQYGID